MPVILALRKRNGGLWAWLIRRVTRSPYDHCEIVLDGLLYNVAGTVRVSRGRWYSSLLWSGGVRRVDEPQAGDWDYIEIGRWRTAQQVEAHYLATQDYRYDVLGIVGSNLLAGRLHMTQAATCSEWCAEALGLPDPQQYNPATLARMAERMNEVTR